MATFQCPPAPPVQ
uniref:Uncharacterized protein n=1 Tax=Anguilla anguilla TaxID=7936 RepID=A0A0E9R242_ANGAN